MTSLREIRRTAITTAKQTKKQYIIIRQQTQISMVHISLAQNFLITLFYFYFLQLRSMLIFSMYSVSYVACEYTGFEEWKFCKVSPLFQTKVLKCYINTLLNDILSLIQQKKKLLFSEIEVNYKQKDIGHTIDRF